MHPHCAQDAAALGPLVSKLLSYLDLNIYLFTHAMHRNSIVIIHLYFINKLLHLKVVKISFPENST